MTQLTLDIDNPSALKALKELVKNMVGVRISKQKKITASSYKLADAYEEYKRGDLVGPFNSVDDLMNDLLD